MNDDDRVPDPPKLDRERILQYRMKEAARTEAELLAIRARHARAKAASSSNYRKMNAHSRDVARANRKLLMATFEAEHSGWKGDRRSIAAFIRRHPEYEVPNVDAFLKRRDRYRASKRKPTSRRPVVLK